MFLNKFKIDSEELNIDSDLHKFLLDETDAYIYVKDINRKYFYVNKLTQKLFQKDLENIIGYDDSNFFELDALSDIIKNDNRVFELGETVEDEELNVIKSNNEIRVYQSVKKPIYNKSDKIVGLFGISTDITEIYLLKEKVNKQNKQLLKAQKVSKMGFWEFNLKNNHLFWSEEIFKIFEIDSSKFEPSYEGFLNVIHSDDRDLVNEAYSNSLKTKEDYSIEHRLLMDDGRVKWVREECSTEFDENGNPLISIGVVLDITELHLTQQKLLDQTYTDYLTKLNNRKSYIENIDKLTSQYKRYKTAFSVIMYDIDNFKQINDTYGHNIGDDVLVQISQLIKSHIRDTDYIFRIGGEEFIILLTETPIDKAKLVSEKIRYSVENDLKTIKDKKITISIGVTEVKDGDTEDSIFKRVDKLLYKSKNNGKNIVTFD